MPYQLKLLKRLKTERWKVRIHDAEGPEEPHVTIYRKARKWRLSLRTGKFLDPGDSWNQIDKGVRSTIEKKWKQLCKEWDNRFKHFNPIKSNDDEKKS